VGFLGHGFLSLVVLIVVFGMYSGVWADKGRYRHKWKKQVNPAAAQPPKKLTLIERLRRGERLKKGVDY
jgi:hypothetical protein